MKKKDILVTVAHGSEEIETVTIVNILRRAGANVTLAKVGGKIEAGFQCKMSRGVTLVADTELRFPKINARTFDAIVIPGGLEGAKSMADDPTLIRMLTE